MGAKLKIVSAGVALGMAAAFAVSACGNPPESAPSASQNGVASLTAQEIVAKANAAALAQQSVQLSGTSTVAGKAVKLDVAMTKSNTSSGTVVIESDTYQYVANQQFVWVKADPSVWAKSNSKAVVDQIGSKWVKAPALDPTLRIFGAFAEYDTILTDMLQPKGEGAKTEITKGDESEVSGQPAIIVIDAENKVQMWVATRGDPLPLRVSTEGSKAGSIELKQWGSATAASPPPDSDTVLVSDLK